LNPRHQRDHRISRPRRPTAAPSASTLFDSTKRANVWTSGGPISRFDQTTKEFSHYNTPGTYGNVVGQNGDEWFTVFHNDGPIVRISKDGQLSKIRSPHKTASPSASRSIPTAPSGLPNESATKSATSTPRQELSRNSISPAPAASPYAIGIDRNHMTRYSSHEQDVLGRLDPKTGEVTEYPFPQSEILHARILHGRSRDVFGSPPPPTTRSATFTSPTQPKSPANSRRLNLEASDWSLKACATPGDGGGCPTLAEAE